MSRSNPTFSPSNREASFDPSRAMGKADSVVVVGSGVFGVWIAWHLLKANVKVTLVDTWGPGNSRSSSGGETRLMRSFYGGSRVFFELSLRALEIWKETEQLTGEQMFYPREIAWFCYQSKNPFVDQSIGMYQDRGLKFLHLSPSEFHKKYPVVSAEGLDRVVIDQEGGFLAARRSCKCLNTWFQKQGGRYIEGRYAPGDIQNGRLQAVLSEKGEKLRADLYVFATGPWMRAQFPDLLNSELTITRQEVHYFGYPNSPATWKDLPCWVDWNEDDVHYGIPDFEDRGFKVAHDRRGETFDPDWDDRLASSAEVAGAREFLARRFPVLKDSPILESRVCQYTNTPDGSLLIDQHPEAANLWLVGGGSGHGFKHGPAVGELVADVLQGKREPLPDFRMFS